MFGINQVQVNSKAGMTFASGLRALLRQDPDVIMIGEIRDYETAEIAVRAVHHRSLGAVHLAHQRRGQQHSASHRHGRPALTSCPRPVNAIIAQRLVKRLCPLLQAQAHRVGLRQNFCWTTQASRTSMNPSAARSATTWVTADVSRYNEIVEMDHRIRKMISAETPIDDVRRAAAENGAEFLADSLPRAGEKGHHQHGRVQTASFYTVG